MELNSATNSSIVMGVAPITLQIEVDLNNGGIWTARAKWGDEDWVNLTQNGTGLSDISSLSIQTSYNNNSFSWGNDSSAGTTSDYVKVDSLKLSEVIAPPVAVSGSDITITGSKFGNSSDASFVGTLVSQEIGNSSQVSTEPVKLEIGVNLSTGNWYSRASFSSGGIYGTPIPLVTDGEGMTDVSSLSIITVQPADSSETWGISADGGDTVKIDSMRLSRK